MKRDLVYTTGELPTRPFDATRFLTPSPHQNRCRRPRVEKVGLARPVEAASVPAGTPRAAQVNTQAAIQNQPAKPAPTNGSSASESGTGPSTQPATSIAAPAEVPAAGAASPAKLPADEAAAAVKAPVQKKATKKPHPASRYASRGEQTNGVRGLRRLFDYQSPFGANVPAEYYPRRGYGGYYREQRSGGYYPDGGFSYR